MSLAALLAFLQANNSTILALWVIFEQYLASNDKIKANSTLQLIIGVIRAIINSNRKP